MKQHTTNYQNTFIEIAEDSPTRFGEVPPTKSDTKTVAYMQFEIISKNPYKFTSDDVLFQIYAIRKDLIKADHKEAREDFFSKGQPCFRSSPLTKRYGWGIHSNDDGKIAIYGAETSEYKKYTTDKNIKTVKAMKSSK